MKALRLVLVMTMLLWAGSAVADSKIVVKELWKAQAIGAAGVLTSPNIDMNERARDGNISLQYTLAGVAGPTITITYKLSNDGVTFSTPSTGGALVTNGAVGSDLLDITAEIEFARWIQIIVTETATNAATAFELFLAFQ